MFTRVEGGGHRSHASAQQPGADAAGEGRRHSSLALADVHCGMSGRNDRNAHCFVEIGEQSAKHA